MPSSDLILNVKQIAGYPTSSVSPTDSVVVQRGGLGGPYYSVSAESLVSGALVGGVEPLQVGIQAPSDAADGQVFTNGLVTPLGGWWQWNAYGDTNNVGRYFQNGPAGQLILGPALGWVFQWGAPGAADQPVSWAVQAALSPTGYLTVGEQVKLGRDPAAPMEAATSQWVTSTIVQYTSLLQSLYSTATVWSFNSRIGNVILNVNDVMGAGGAPIFSPVFQGNPTAPTPAPADNSNAVATTAWTWATVASTIGSLDLSGYAPLASPAFGGMPTAPTAAPGNATGQIATTAFVHAAVISSTTGVSSFNTRTGAVVLTGTDITGAGGVLATGAVTSFNTRTGAITLTAGDIAAAGGAPLASPALTGVPTAPTATAGTGTTQLATCAYVQNAVSALTAGVASFNGRIGAVTLIANDISAAGGAVLASPAFTGTPTAPTAVATDSSTTIATTAFVKSAIANPATVAPLMNGTAAVGTSLLYARQDHVHPTDTSRAAASALAGYLPLTGGTLTGALAGTTFTASGGVTSNSGGMVCNAASAGGNSTLSINDLNGSPARGYVGWVGSLSAMILNNNVANSYLELGPDGSFTFTGNGQAYKLNGGSWTATSDARIKTVFGEYDHGLSEVLQLRPVEFAYKGNTARPGDPPASPVGRRFIGLVAQEVEAFFPEMVEKVGGYIDGEPVGDLRTLDTTPLIFALVNCVKQLASRVAALEAA